MNSNVAPALGIDVGTECVKALILKNDGSILGRSTIATSGLFQEKIQEAINSVLDEAQLKIPELSGVCATGFAASCVADATMRESDTVCHARGAFHHFNKPMSIIDIGGWAPKVIQISKTGRPIGLHTARRCATGIGTFLIFASRHLDIHPTRLQELASGVKTPAEIGSYCSVFADLEILERLREGKSLEEVALGCIHSVAERIAEIGGFIEPVYVTGGVAEYFPGVLTALTEMTGHAIESVPAPITTGALGAALKVFSSNNR